MNSLVNIFVFGTVGALMMAAVLGLLLIRTGRPARRGMPVAFSAMVVVVLLAVPALAASTVLAAGTGAGFGEAYLVAFGVVTLTYLANVALLPLVARRVAAEHGTERAAQLRPSPATLVGGLLICSVFGLVSTGIAVLAG
ncbi:hypothetical protein F4561_001558 [Lipingzhangella halophila]|uniref:Uncharacterized protein n=1 Tax=Lipingzhangella halophila TaxID=1783352 RepID=A0A7W7REW7_9ACTN|nr:hypothetical protein [Lipingzhangella halophila]MBB4930738.1 hypothetical protein [Lipingzhangella halophila]